MKSNTGMETVNFTVSKGRGENASARLFVSASARIEGKSRKRTRSVMCRGAVKALKEVVEWRFAHTGREAEGFSVDMVDTGRLAAWFALNATAREAARGLDDELLNEVLRSK